jgi:hypothetical protein
VPRPNGTNIFLEQPNNLNRLGTQSHRELKSQKFHLNLTTFSTFCRPNERWKMKLGLGFAGLSHFVPTCLSHLQSYIFPLDNHYFTVMYTGHHVFHKKQQLVVVFLGSCSETQTLLRSFEDSK